MATVSSHILDSVSGKSAIGIRVVLNRLNGDTERETLFDRKADDEGRISEAIELNGDNEYELQFYSAAYFSLLDLPNEGSQMLKTVVVRFIMSDNFKRYHIPLMLSPHSYSLWWS